MAKYVDTMWMIARYQDIPRPLARLMPQGKQSLRLRPNIAGSLTGQKVDYTDKNGFITPLLASETRYVGAILVN